MHVFDVEIVRVQKSQAPGIEALFAHEATTDLGNGAGGFGREHWCVAATKLVVDGFGTGFHDPSGSYCAADRAVGSPTAAAAGRNGVSKAVGRWYGR